MTGAPDSTAARPAVSVVMPFAGSPSEARAALEALQALRVTPDDQLILVDNAGTAPAADGIEVVHAVHEASPAHARNVGAAHAGAAWILFLDADTQAPGDLLDRYFTAPIDVTVGALAGAVTAASDHAGLAARYGAAKGFLDQDAHLAHPYLPRAVAANLLVRRAAFEQVGGFFEGVRAAEDTDFSWRLQRAGWRLEGRPGAAVEHRYRTSLRALRRQWRGYAAGRAWLARRYDGFVPEPALRRAAARALHRRGRPDRSATATATATPTPTATTASAPSRLGRRDRAAHAALDAVLGVEELAGFALSNRPRRGPRRPVQVVLVADRFPGRDDPLADYALSLAGARVEASARPEAPARLARGEAPMPWVDYREDDGALTRLAALARLLVRHPLRCARDVLGHGPEEPGLVAIAPAVARLRRDRGARLRPLGGSTARALAVRLSRLSGRRLEA